MVIAQATHIRMILWKTLLKVYSNLNPVCNIMSISCRADAEEKYGKALVRLAESAKGKEEIG